MIITKDMLVQKGCASLVINIFAREFLFGLDLTKPIVTHTNVNSAYLFIETIAKLFSYTGLFTNDNMVTLNQLHYVNGVIENFPNGNPAKVCFDKVFNCISTLSFYKNGLLHNPEKLKPARIVYNHDGTLFSRIFYENGVRNDPYNGIPAYLHYCYPKNYIEHYKNGVPI